MLTRFRFHWVNLGPVLSFTDFIKGLYGLHNFCWISKLYSNSFPIGFVCGPTYRGEVNNVPRPVNMKFCNLLWSLAVVLASLLAITLAYDRAMLRTYFQCPPCDESACPSPAECPGVLVKEPGLCGCCMTCARLEGEPCGVFTERCAPGLMCQPFTPEKRNAEGGWQNLFRGKGVCIPKPGKMMDFLQPSAPSSLWSTP